MAGRGIVIQIQGDGESARLALQMVREQMDATKHHAGELEGALERIGRVVEYYGIYEAMRRAADGVKELVGGSLELGESLEKASKKTGLAVESLSVMHYAAALTGSDFDSLTSALAKMDKTIGAAADGNKQAGAFIRSLGLDAKDLAHRADGAEIAFHAFLKTLAATESPIERVRLATGLLGKAGAEQIPVLLDLAENWDFFKQKASDAGVLLNGDTAKALADTNQRMKDLEQHVQGAGLAFTTGLSPGLSQFFSILSGGKGDMVFFEGWGERLAAILNLGAAAAYGFASGLARIASIEETDTTQTMKHLAEDLDAKAQQFRQAMVNGNSPAGKPFIPATPKGSGGGGFDGTGGGGGKTKSGNAIAEAQATLIDEQTRAQAAALKVAGQVQLADLEVQHKAVLISDSEFYAAKLKIATDALDFESLALLDRQSTLEALLKHQAADKTLQRDKQGHSAQELRTQKELVDIGKQLNDIGGKRAELQSVDSGEQADAASAANLASLKIAAELEKERNNAITAQIALIREEHAVEAQKVKAKGGSDADAANEVALGEVLVKKLEIEQISQRIADTERETKRAVDELNDAAAKDPRLKKAATQQINELNKQEAANLRTLVAEYDALAQLLGGEFLQKAKDLHTELNKLNTPNQRDDANFTKTLGDGVASMGRQISEQAIMGKTSFHQMAKSIEKDALDLAIKLATQKWLTPALNAAFSIGTPATGASAEHHLSGGLSSDGPQVIGEEGPEVWTPPSGGGSITPNSMLSKLAETGGGGKGISVTSNIVNQSSQPVTAQPSQVSYDSDLKSFVIHTILEDHSTGGMLSQAQPRG